MNKYFSEPREWLHWYALTGNCNGQGKKAAQISFVLRQTIIYVNGEEIEWNSFRALRFFSRRQSKLLNGLVGNANTSLRRNDKQKETFLMM